MANWSFTQEAMNKYDADQRRATIEDCARVAEKEGKGNYITEFIVRAIRALKDKP